MKINSMMDSQSGETIKDLGVPIENFSYFRQRAILCGSIFSDTVGFYLRSKSLRMKQKSSWLARVYSFSFISAKLLVKNSFSPLKE